MDAVAPFVGAWIEMVIVQLSITLCRVAPFVGAWIEILTVFLTCTLMYVAPFVGAWIEIAAQTGDTWCIYMSLRSSERGLKYKRNPLKHPRITSLRSSERGLKFKTMNTVNTKFTVAPFVGAWIEINVDRLHLAKLCVAPFVGAWIEIEQLGQLEKMLASLRSSERGLKSLVYEFKHPGSWSLRSSERGLKFVPCVIPPCQSCRSVRRSVD